MILVNKLDSKHLAEVYNFLTDEQVLTCMFDCTVGVIDEGVKGYTKTHYKIDTSNYNEAKETVEQANKIIHPNKSTLDIAKIELSSF